MRSLPRVLCRLIFGVSFGLCSVVYNLSLTPFPAFGRQVFQGSEKPNSCLVSGQILQAGTNEPIRRAQVVLDPTNKRRDPYQTSTDTTGRFQIEQIEPGQYRLVVSKVGYLTLSYGQDSPNETGAIVTLTSGKKLADLLFRMIPWSVISGRVTDEDGQPLAGADVLALRSQMQRGIRTFVPSQSVKTDDLGNYRLYSLTKGHYYLRAEYLGLPAMPSHSAYIPVFYPGTPDVSRAQSVDVLAGQETASINFKLVPAGAVRLRGTVFNSILGRPATACCVYLEPRASNIAFDSFDRPGHTLGANGTFEIDNVAPGSFNLVATAFVKGKIHYAELPLEVGDADVSNIKLTIPPGVDIAGRVAVEGGSRIDFSALRVQLERIDSNVLATRPVNLKPDGTFSLEDVAAGTYDVNVLGGPPEVYLKSAQIKGDDILYTKFEVNSAMAGSFMQIVLSAAGSQFDGTVTDDSDMPIPAATVVFIPEGARRNQFRLCKESQTDQYGRFNLRGITPGDYKVFAWKGIEKNEWQDADFLKRFESKGIEVRASEGQRRSLSLKLIANTTPG
jgi:hypothetical protein